MAEQCNLYAHEMGMSINRTEHCRHDTTTGCSATQKHGRSKASSKGTAVSDDDAVIHWCEGNHTSATNNDVFTDRISLEDGNIRVLLNNKIHEVMGCSNEQQRRA